jgi:hypothetical protein
MHTKFRGTPRLRRRHQRPVQDLDRYVHWSLPHGADGTETDVDTIVDGVIEW